MICRGCASAIKPEHVFCDLGAQPLANELLTEHQLGCAQAVYPLRPMICWNCRLVQLPYCPPPEDIFTADYPFYAGLSGSWLAHCKEMAKDLTAKHRLGPTSRVLDIGSNDGTLLRCFRGCDVQAVGVEPSAGVAQHAQMNGLATFVDWWGTETAIKLLQTRGIPISRSWKADLVTCTNVLAHVPDLHDFLNGVRMILAPSGVAYFEFPYLGSLVQMGQFDQIYAEHHSYFSLSALRSAMQRVGMRMCAAEFLPDIHGGSMRVSADTGPQGTMEINLGKLLQHEREQGLDDVEKLREFASRPPTLKRQAWHLLDGLQERGLKIAGYGASAKAAVMLNYFGIGCETIEFVADITGDKWGKYISGCRIPIMNEDALRVLKPDVVVNFCWNWATESEKRIRRVLPDAQIVYLSAHPASTKEVSHAA